MKIKHYRAADMRTALRQVRDAQGPDAVILSSRRVQGGVEVVAAIDYDGEDAATEQLAAGMSSAHSGLVDTYGADRRAAQAQSGREVSNAASARAQHDPALFGSVSKSHAPMNEYMSERAELTRQFAGERSQAAQKQVGERGQAANQYMAADDDAEGHVAGRNDRAGRGSRNTPSNDRAERS
ncbi:MAG TPA: hypothetical protein VNR40_02205, partial [Steroidobacter sp.]|nr:hypothetical protein [Steroidobacter sp.]